MWICDPYQLISIDILPDIEDDPSEIVNKGTRMLLIILLIMWFYAYDGIQIAQVAVCGIIIIAILSLWMTNKKEKFSQLPINMTDRIPPTVPVSAPVSVPVKEIRVEKVTPISELSSKTMTLLTIEKDTESPTKTTSISQLSPSGISEKTMKSLSIDKAPSEMKSVYQGYSYQSHKQVKKQENFYTPDMGENENIVKERVVIAPRMLDPQFQNSETSFLGNENPVQDLGGMSFTNPRPRTKKSFMLEPTQYEKPSVANRPNRMFLQDVQPNQYSFTNDRTPVNANIGISYTPQIPPLQKQTIMGDDGRSYPLFSRIDPELVRDDVPEERRQEMPLRNQWSEELPETNQLNETTVYDPRFTGYGDSARAYYDSNLGNVRYYYTDVDSYRSPNFVIRNKVDHVDMVDPMDKVYSEYPRTASLDDVHDQVQDDWMAKSTEFREDIMEKLMRKNNAMNWQMRFAPKSKGARLSTFTSSY